MSLATSRQQLGKISYPPMGRRVPKSIPISSPESKALLEGYRRSVEGKKNEMKRFVLTQDNNTAPDAEQLLEEGKASLQEGDLDAALGDLLEAIRMGVDTAEVYRLVGEAYQDKGMADDALEMYTRCTLLDPMDISVYHSKGDCYLMLDDPANAVDQFERYLKMEEPMYDLLVKTGKACLDADRYDRAAELLHNALEINPNDPYVFYNFGELYEKSGNPEKANEYFGKVVEADPKFPNPYLRQARAELQRGNLELALHLYESILKIVPTSPSVYMACADIYLQLGEEFAHSALSCMSKAITLDTGDGVPDDSALMDPADGEDDEEPRDPTPVVPDGPPHKNMYVRRGILLFDHFHDVEGAIADFTVCLGMHPHHDYALEYRATCFRQRNAAGDLAAARADYELLVTLDQVGEERRGPPHLFLAEYYFKEDQPITAADHYQSAWLCGVSSMSTEKVVVSFVKLYLRNHLMQAAKEGSARGGAASAGNSGREHHVVVSLAPTPGTHRERSASSAGAPAAPAEPPAPLTTMEDAKGVLPLGHLALDSWYMLQKSYEPTAHTPLSTDFQTQWGPYRTAVLKRREEEAVVGKASKKGTVGKRR